MVESKFRDTSFQTSKKQHLFYIEPTQRVAQKEHSQCFVGIWCEKVPLWGINGLIFRNLRDIAQKALFQLLMLSHGINSSFGFSSNSFSIREKDIQFLM